MLSQMRSLGRLLANVKNINSRNVVSGFNYRKFDRYLSDKTGL